jgi:hypothetical protein
MGTADEVTVPLPWVPTPAEADTGDGVYHTAAGVELPVVEVLLLAAVNEMVPVACASVSLLLTKSVTAY